MISIITPTHNTKWLAETMDSLKAQTFQGNWEWVILPNNGAAIPNKVANYDKVRIVPFKGGGIIGAIKHFACEHVKGDIVVELDHDDLLTPQALQSIAHAFMDEKVDFVYSNHAEFQDKSFEPHVYNSAYGWQTRQREFYGRKFEEILSFPATAQSHTLVHYAPNHVRAWRARSYWDIGGHDETLPNCDDHDLCCRFYLNKRMKLIDDCLYLYRLHGDNSYLLKNKEIQDRTKQVRNKYIWKMAERWADLNSLSKVDLGAGHNKPAGYIGIDRETGAGVDIIHDVTKGLPFDDNSVGIIRAFDFLEHIPASVSLMNEIYRVLVDGGWLLSLTPSSDGRGAFQDPTHCSFWNENSFWYYTNADYAKYVPQISCRFQAQRIQTSFPSRFHEQHKIPYVYADLTAVKTWRRRPGLIQI